MLAPKRIDLIEDDLRAQVRAHIDGFASQGYCDVMADLAVKFPTQAILTLFGLPVADMPRFLEWVDGTIKDASVNNMGADPTPRQIECATALFAYLQEHVTLKRARPGDDMLSDILALNGDDAWSEPEILGMCFLFVLAGLDTVTGAIGFCMLNLAKDAALRRRLIDNPTLIPRFTEEVLRTEGPIPLVTRKTTTDVDLAGSTIPAGAHVVVMLATANHEGRTQGDPHLMNLAKTTAHLGFGGGIHRCLGSHLARRELRLTIEEFHARIQDYHLAGTPNVQWPSGTLQLKSLPLEFAPSTR
jgi:cytochrome P450